MLLHIVIIIISMFAVSAWMYVYCEYLYGCMYDVSLEKKMSASVQNWHDIVFKTKFKSREKIVYPLRCEMDKLLCAMILMHAACSSFRILFGDSTKKLAKIAMKTKNT